MPRQYSTASRGISPSSDGRGLHIGIVAARFNEAITSRLYDGAISALRHCGVADRDVAATWVPGALELPWAALRMARSHGQLDAIVALGCVIRGETYHFEVVADGAVRGIQEASLAADLPIAFGVLTTYDQEQALARSGGEHGNVGADAAETAVYMGNLRRQGLSGTHDPDLVGAQSMPGRSADG